MKQSAKLLVAFSVVTAALSYGSYRYGLSSVAEPKLSDAPKADLRIGPPSIVKNQQALAVGIVSQKDDQSITVKGDDGKQTKFKLSPNVTVNTIATGSATPSKPSQDQATIELNKKALVSLELKGSEYLVTNITYIPQ